MPWLPSGSTVVTTMSLLAAKTGTRSAGGCSYQSASPALSAAAAVRRVGDIAPFDAVGLCHLAAAGEARQLLARHLIRVPDKDRLVAGNPRLLDEFERAGADRLRDLLVSVGLRKPLRHHERHIAGELAERIEDQRERGFQLEREGFVVDGLNLPDDLHQLLAERVPLAPAFERGDAIGGADRLSVVPFQALAQRESIGQLIAAGCPAIDHLRLRLEVLVEREQRVENQIAEIAGDIRRRPDRVDAPEIRLRDEAERLLRGLGRSGRRDEAEANGPRRSRHSQPLGESGHRFPVRAFLSERAYAIIIAKTMPSLCVAAVWASSDCRIVRGSNGQR